MWISVTCTDNPRLVSPDLKAEHLVSLDNYKSAKEEKRTTLPPKLPVSRGVECTERGWERHPLLPHCYTFISILTAARCSHFILIYVLHNIICLPENPVLLSGPPNILENFAQFISHLFCFWLINGRWWKVSVVDPHTSSLVTPPRPEFWENVLAFFVSGCWLLSIFPAY